MFNLTLTKLFLTSQEECQPVTDTVCLPVEVESCRTVTESVCHEVKKIVFKVREEGELCKDSESSSQMIEF